MKNLNTFVSGNYYDKYRSTNSIHRLLISRFLSDASELCRSTKPRRVLEIGCGPGDLALSLFGRLDARPAYVGLDISRQEIETARHRCPFGTFLLGSAHDLPFDAGEFDLVIACEVFEHVEHPAQAMREVHRVTSSHFLASVPWEPVWRIANLLRGQYLSRLGNTPGHINHFSRRAIRSLIAGRFDVLDERHPFPWTMILAGLKDAPHLASPSNRLRELPP